MNPFSDIGGQSLPASLELQTLAGGGELSELRDRDRVTAVGSAVGREGTERQADTDDDSRQKHADGVLGGAAGGKHDVLLGLLSAMSALLRGWC